MNPKLQTIIKPPTLPDKAGDEVRAEKWAECTEQYGLSGEWAVAAKLGAEVSEEQIEMIGHLFGR
ncbi:hypothetical protein ACOR62_01185 [Neisseria lisongii]|uniref:Phage associated protein n=1 Tax=Neisseria lisongii TaxID=2912188 RepID=A0AAW5AKS0_9NEIS|nr:hypothetical protein [Neisseria lisongii]MCF7529089.1 hypothetical protein [Neisseria lisongii]